MARSTYHDQFQKLLDRGYLVPSTGNTFDFYEVAQPATRQKNSVSADGLNFEECTSGGQEEGQAGQAVLAENIEINNTAIPNNTGTNNGSPEVKEVHISVPEATGRGRPKYSPKPSKEGFEF